MSVNNQGVQYDFTANLTLDVDKKCERIRAFRLKGFKIFRIPISCAVKASAVFRHHGKLALPSVEA